MGMLPLVPVAVIAQVSRTPKQAQLRRLLRGCEVTAFEEAHAHRVGAMLGRAKTRDVVDGCVAELAIRASADVLTSDPDDLRRLVASERAEVEVIAL
jgi:hypothetical protein